MPATTERPATMPRVGWPSPVARRARGGGGPREVLLARAALGVIAVAVLDDAFVHPEPGTSAGDHLVSGLVPVALAVALALALPRLRPGARATASIVCGVLAVTAGVADGLRPVLVDRLSGDDVTALLAGVAGVVLVALGALLLGRSRRRDGPRPRRYARRALLALGAAVAGFFVLFPAAFAIVATHRARQPVPPADLGRPYERVTLRTEDGLRLAGWYVPSRNRAAVIALPGRRGPVAHARMLARHGYGVLLLDRRGEGQSEGDANAFGWGGTADLQAALGFLAERPDVDARRIGGLGLSVGGELLLETAARDARLRAVVSEGAGARSLGEQLHVAEVPTWMRPLSTWTVQTLALRVLGGAPQPPALPDVVDEIAPRPVLLICALDGNADEQLNRVYLDAAQAPKQLWEVPEGGHTGALAARPREYERRVVGFLDGALLRAGAR